MTARVTLRCSACKTELRMVVPGTLGVDNAPMFCVYCGASPIMVTQDSERDFWDVMEETFHLPRATLEVFYEAWRQEPEGFIRYYDYVINLLKKAVASGGERTE